MQEITRIWLTTVNNDAAGCHMQGSLIDKHVKEKFTSLVERNSLYNNVLLHIK
jgi:hypothetical protein